MKKITIIRHAESLFNAGLYKTEQDIINCKLSENGKIQSKQLNHSFDLLILSPLKRAIETYVNSNIKTKEIMINDLFREYKENSALNFLENEEVKSETKDELNLRIIEAKEYLKNLPQNNIGIISHGIFIYYFIQNCALSPKLIHNSEAITFYL